MRITPDRRIELAARKPQDVYRPSCNLLMASAANAYGSGTVGVILTGMGSDGAEGMARIKACGGLTLAQDEKTSVVFGMPRAAIEKGCVDRVLSLDQIGTEILGLAAVKSEH
jgi:two-component system chemotaxis response regulator CheB